MAVVVGNPVWDVDCTVLVCRLEDVCRIAEKVADPAPGVSADDTDAIWVVRLPATEIEVDEMTLWGDREDEGEGESVGSETGGVDAEDDNDVDDGEGVK
jgi:hypothetical protein